MTHGKNSVHGNLKNATTAMSILHTAKNLVNAPSIKQLYCTTANDFDKIINKYILAHAQLMSVTWY